jgi:hypothetical protein
MVMSSIPAKPTVAIAGFIDVVVMVICPLRTPGTVKTDFPLSRFR